MPLVECQQFRADALEHLHTAGALRSAGLLDLGERLIAGRPGSSEVGVQGVEGR